MNIKAKFTCHGIVILSALAVLNVFILGQVHAEDLTTLDGRTFTKISEVTKYPKMVVLTYDGNREPVQNTNLPPDFVEKYKIIVKTNPVAQTAASVAADPDSALLATNSDLLACTNAAPETRDIVTNRFSETIVRTRNWQMCLEGQDVSLTFYGSENITNKQLQRISFQPGEVSMVKQAFDKFIEWNSIATTNKSEPFEKPLLQLPTPNDPLNLLGPRLFSFKWDPDLYGGAIFYNSGGTEGDFDIDTVTQFDKLLDKLPALKAGLLDQIHSRDAQKSLFK